MQQTTSSPTVRVAIAGRSRCEEEQQAVLVWGGPPLPLMVPAGAKPMPLGAINSVVSSLPNSDSAREASTAHDERALLPAAAGRGCVTAKLHLQRDHYSAAASAPAAASAHAGTVLSGACRGTAPSLAERSEYASGARRVFFTTEDAHATHRRLGLHRPAAGASLRRGLLVRSCCCCCCCCCGGPATSLPPLPPPSMWAFCDDRRHGQLEGRGCAAGGAAR
jgi:hypothetical protein